MSSRSAEDQGSSADEITFPPSQATSPSVNLVSTGTAQTSDSDDSGAPPPNSNNGEDESRRKEDLNYRRTHGTCMYYPTDDRHPCQLQRSCYDCLNFNITTEPEGCFVNPMGQCVSMPMYDPAMDFRLGEPSNELAAEFVTAGYNGTSGNSSEPATENGQNENQQFDFIAGNATYCENDDAQCLLCRATAFAEIIYHNSDNSRSRYCYGQNGCVCVAICEAIQVSRHNPDKSCMIKAMSTDIEDTPVSQVGSIAAILGAMCFIVASVFVIYRIRKRGESSASDGDNEQGSSLRHHHNRRDSDEDDPVVTPADGASPVATATPVMRAGSGSGLLLNLFGWTAMREVVIQKEQMQAAGIEDAALGPVKNNNVQLIGAEPSAPDAEAALPTAPPVMIPYATLAVASAPVAISVRAMAAPSAPDFEDRDSIDGDDFDMAEL
ncbi:Maltose acetyltransferase [Phytophthora pseudosyringae]|uniref:Maltose acetyltransferase n=1 Tax=Phytophthora pseudosyringae TaxID=221518 RepID=A0A8T1VYG8_9STRA|nr:Maltose acetyltransferase [Phytophthora pseudosyringae]